MTWLSRVVHSFIMTFGITQPTEEKRRVAERFIGGLLLLTLLAFLAMIAFGIRHMLT